MKSASFLVKFIYASIFFMMAVPSLQALGTVDKGWIYVEKVKKLENRGLMFNSWEGVLVVTSYDKKEKCDKKKDECYTSMDREQAFSIRKDNRKVIEFINKENRDGDFLIQYRIHRIEKITLSSRFEIVDVAEVSKALPENFPQKLIVKKTGYRNFAIDGEILRFGRQGIICKTYEGLYRDKKSDKIQPFSVTQKEMANYIFTAMKSSAPFSMGVSVSLVKFVRKSKHDIFEINYEGKAGISP